jgi:hypothetical protein
VAGLEETSIIDREAEAETFNGLLACSTPRRIMVVSGKSGMGKSVVLRKLRYLCEYTHSVPVALADLADFQDRPDTFALVAKLRKLLGQIGPAIPAAFPQFDDANEKRNSPAGVTLPVMPPVQGTVDARNATVSGQGQVGGVIYNVSMYGGPSARTDEADAAARERCAELFLDDLLDCARQQPVVLLFDSMEKAGDELKRWIFLDLIRKRLLPNRKDCKLIVVLAGQDLAQMVSDRLQATAEDSIEPASLSRWNIHHVADFLRVNKLGGLGEGELRTVLSVLDMGYPLTAALTVAQAFVNGAG